MGEVGLWLKSVGPDQEDDAPADEAERDRCEGEVSLKLVFDSVRSRTYLSSGRIWNLERAQEDALLLGRIML